MKLITLFSLIVLTTLSCRIALGQNLAWTPTQGPYATTVNTFDTAAGLVFAGTNAGLYKSTDGGISWNIVPAVSGIVYDIVYKDTMIYSAGAGGINVSTDKGITWAARDTGLPLFPLVYALKNVKDTFYACLGGEGFYFSTDGGAHWALPSNDALGKSVFSMVITGTSLIFAEGAGILRSTNNGFSWDEPTGTIADQTIHTFAMKGKTIFAGTEAGVFISIDDGATWASSSGGMKGNDIITSITFSSDQKTIFAGTRNASNDGGIYRSSDGGANWQLTNSGLTSLAINGLFTNGSQIFTGTSLGISQSSNNGNSWQTVSEGLPKPAVTCLGAIYTIMFAGTPGSYLFRTDDAGDHWMQYRNGITQKNVNAIVTDGLTAFAGTNGVSKQGLGGVHRSTDYGNSWVQTNTGMPVMTITNLSKYGTNIVACGDSGIYSSSDNGQTWTGMSPSIIAKAIYTDDSSFYVITKFSAFSYTKNAGWLPLITPQNQNITSLTKKGKYIFAGTDSGVYRDSLGTWARVTDTLGVQCLWSNNYIVIAGTKTGIYISSDDGATWLFQQSAGAIPVNAICAGVKILYAATSAGVIKATLGQFGVKNASGENPLSLQVTNPSHDRALIHYGIQKRSNVSIVAYDLLGKPYNQITHGLQDAGEYDLQWNTSTIPSGTYMLRLTSGGRQVSAMVNVMH